MGSPRRRKGRRSQHKELKWLLEQLWLRLAMPWEIPPCWALVEPSFHALPLGKDHGYPSPSVGCRKGFLDLSLA